MIKKANETDVKIVYELSKKTKFNMLKNNLKQWVGDYPKFDNFYQDYLKDGLYVYILNDQIIASISILEENDPPYKVIKWSKNNSLVIIAYLLSQNIKNKGLVKLCLVRLFS